MQNLKDIANMNRYLSLAMLFSSSLYASDAISVDSIFKKNNGIRSITSLDLITSNNTRTFTSYPTMSSYDDGSNVTESRQSVLNETILYGYDSKIDFIFSGTYVYDRTTYAGVNSNYSETDTRFDAVWIGAKYDFDSILGQLKPSITIQTALLQNFSYQKKNIILKVLV